MNYFPFFLVYFNLRWNGNHAILVIFLLHLMICKDILWFGSVFLRES